MALTNKRELSSFIRVLPIAAIILFVVVITIYAYPRSGLPITTNPSDWGTFGDFVGGILNPLFGIFTLIGLVVTVSLQRDILDLQKQELADTRQELAKSAQALDIQNRTMLAQNFEGTFFQMLRRQNELLEKIESPIGGGRTVTGLTAITNLIQDIRHKFREKQQDFLRVYESRYANSGVTIGPYFRNLYHLLKLIDQNQSLNESEKIKYANLARAQLSSTEIALIFYNCLSKHGEGLKPLIIKYRFLKHINEQQLCDPDLISDNNLYPRETYLARD